MIRRDLYAVKERGNGFGWQFVYVCRTLATARRLRGCLGPELGFSHKTKLVHPSQDVVDLYVLCGNEVYE